MQHETSHGPASGRDESRDIGSGQILAGDSNERVSSDSFARNLVDAAAKADSEEKRRRTIAERQFGNLYDSPFTNASLILDRSTNNRAQASRERVYQACLPCKKRKTKCVRGDEMHPDELPCARCRRQGKVSECVLAPRGWLSGDMNSPNKAAPRAPSARASSSQAASSPGMSLMDHISQARAVDKAQVVDVGALREFAHHAKPDRPAFTTSSSGSAALDQLMSNVQDLRQAAPEREPEGGSDADSQEDNSLPRYDINEPHTVMSLPSEERNKIPLEDIRQLPGRWGVYTWDLRDWGSDDEMMVDREMSKRPYTSASEARRFRNDRGLGFAEADALNHACLDLDRREARHWAYNPPYTKPSSQTRQRSANSSRDQRPPASAQPSHRVSEAASLNGAENSMASTRTPPAVPSHQPTPGGYGSMGPPQRTSDEEEEEVKLRLKILAVEKEELELQLRLHCLRGAKRRRLN